MARFVANKFGDGSGALAGSPMEGLQPASCSADAIWSRASALLAQLGECCARGAVPRAGISPDGRFQLDWRGGNYCVYTGLAGVAVAYLRAGLFCRRIRKDEPAAMQFLSKARGLAEECLRRDHPREVSFMCGAPGYLAVACTACAELGDFANTASYLEQLLGFADSAVSHKEDELLFGRAGYLHALLATRRALGDAAASADFDTPLRRTAERLVETGRKRATQKYQDWPLMWHCFHEPYIGAAHGVLGILTMLLHCASLLCAASRSLVAGCVQKLLTVRLPSGNLPITLGDARDEHVHWCHGAPGLPGLAAAANAAADVLPHEVLRATRDAAILAGEVVWQRGVILKGNGLCHGIAGNGYSFLTLYKLTGEAHYLQRAGAFATLLDDEQVQRAVGQHRDPQRKVQGVPDSPLSLLEGSAGVFCYLLDIADPSRSSFPGWEL